MSEKQLKTPSSGAPRHPLPKGEGKRLPAEVPPLHEREGRGEGGVLPQGWEETTLAEIGSWCSGGTPSRSKPEYFAKGVPWVKSGDLPDGLILKTEEEITETGLNSSSAKLLPAGTISMALYGATSWQAWYHDFPCCDKSS